MNPPENKQTTPTQKTTQTNHRGQAITAKSLCKSGQNEATDPPDMQMWGHKKNAKGRSKMAPKEHPTPAAEAK